LSSKKEKEKTLSEKREKTYVHL